MKFAMESDALVDLGQRTQAESEDLGVLVRMPRSRWRVR